MYRTHVSYVYRTVKQSYVQMLFSTLISTTQRLRPLGPHTILFLDYQLYGCSKIFLPTDYLLLSDNMASASAVLQEIGKDFLECGICFERYTNPKILSCVHSFCEKCLVQYYGNDVVKTCPLCRQETRLPVPGGIGGLKTNGFLITLREKVELQEKVAKITDGARRTCELCSENEVTHHCLNCSQNICQSCMKIHPRIKGMADHIVGTLENICRGKVTLPEEQKEVTCIKHKGEINRFYCETCHVLICRDCVVVDHCKPEHQYIDRATASSKYKKAWNEIFPMFTKEIKYFKKCLENKYPARQDFERKIAQTVQEVKIGADQLRDKVNAEEDRILGEIRVLKKDHTTAFEEHIKSMKSLLQRKQHTLTIARDVTNKGSESDFLSLFPIINQDLTFLRCYVPPQIDANFHYQRLDKTVSIELGKLDVGSKWELRCEVGGDLGRYGPMSFWDVTALRGDKLAGTTTDGRMAIFNTAGKVAKTIQLDGRQCGIASFHYGPVVADGNGGVQIYNEDFTLASHRLYEVPQDINQKKRGSMNYTKSRLLQKTFTDHTSICTRKDGTLLLGHPRENMIKIHHPDGRQTPITRISLKTPTFLAIDFNDRVVVSGFNNQVIVIDDQGATLVTIKPTMNGQPVIYCRGVCCDSSCIYVVVGYGYGSHIHRYDGDGKFLSCIIQGLNQPNGITLTEDGQHLAAADDKGVKVYQRV